MKKDDTESYKKKENKQFSERPQDLYAKEGVTFNYINDLDNYKHYLNKESKRN